MIVVPHIKLATAAEAQSIAEMSKAYIEYGLGWSWTQDRVLNAIHDPSTNVIVIHERGGLAAFGIMQYGERTAHLALLAVCPALRKRGLAARVVAWLEKCAMTAGLERIHVEARSDNPGAITFYEKQGYRTTEKVGRYYRGVLDAIRLEKTLGSANRPS